MRFDAGLDWQRHDRCLAWGNKCLAIRIFLTRFCGVGHARVCRAISQDKKILLLRRHHRAGARVALRALLSPMHARPRPSSSLAV